MEVRTTTARAIAERKQVERHQQHAESESADWERKAQVAVDKGRDDLARAALLEKRHAAEKAEHLEIELKVLSETLDKLTADTMALQNKLKDAKSRQKIDNHSRQDGAHAIGHSPPPERPQCQ